MQLSEIQVKVEFQALMVQLFLQRRYQHVLMATRFYRAVFNDGDSKLNVGKEAKDLFEKSVGSPPTVSTLDSLANEALRDVREGVKTFDFLLASHELESASKRLAEAFAVGEYVPEIRTLPREKKRQTLEFVQKANKLLSTMEAKDYTEAEKLINDLGKTAKDFDASKPRAFIESSHRGAQLHLAKARNAALSGDKETLEKSLAAAAELWPLNPQLAEVSNMIFSQGDVQQKAVVDFDQLLGQKNYRQIFDNNARFIAALALYPDKSKQLQEVLQNMQKIEGAILRANEMARQSNYAGAWESVERIAGNFPDDSKLNQVRADLTTQAADFVRTLRSAQDLEKKEQVGSSLAWFLKAQKLYPQSEYAGEGIDRLAKRIVPEN
jgi:roadblock/LC7 domain-containing protein